MYTYIGNNFLIMSNTKDTDVCSAGQIDPGHDFEADPAWTHSAAREIMRFLKEKWRVNSVMFNDEYIWNIYTIVGILKTHYSDAGEERRNV